MSDDQPLRTSGNKSQIAAIADADAAVSRGGAGNDYPVIRLLTFAALAVGLSVICQPCESQAVVAAAPHAAAAGGFIVTMSDSIDRPYVELGKVSATASTVNWAHPLNTDIGKKLRAKAEKMGADAVIRVRFSPASDGLGEGGGLRGTGVAIKFTQPQTSKPQ